MTRHIDTNKRGVEIWRAVRPDAKAIPRLFLIASDELAAYGQMRKAITF